mmetsp:Transcript_600/g.1858  ORF Transcript_600/g.1858 Transcript_600/m.1858 type:complete len:258 (+) Transcript_600:909-1682(+)
MVPDSAPPMPKRPLFKISIATLKPLPGTSITLAAGTRTFSRYTSAVFEHLMPIFFSGAPDVTPAIDRSTMNAVMWFLVGLAGSAVSGVAANTVKTSAMPPFEIQILDPLMTQSSPSLTALVVTLFASEPVPGSVSANAATYSPVASFGRYFCFCSSLPKRRIPLKPIDWWAPIAMDRPRSDPIISPRRAYAEFERPRPSSSVGTCRPISPSSFTDFHVPSGIDADASFAAGSFSSSNHFSMTGTSDESSSRCSLLST